MFTASLTISDLDFTTAEDAARALLACDARPLHVTVTNQHTGKVSEVVVSDWPDTDQTAAKGMKLCAECGNDFSNGEYAPFARWDWLQAVAQRSTSLGYWEWAAAAKDDAEFSGLTRGAEMPSPTPPMGCVIEPHGDGFRYHFDGDDDDDPRVYPTEAEACAAAHLIG